MNKIRSQSIFFALGVFVIATVTSLPARGQLPTPIPARVPTSVNKAASSPTAKSTTPQDEGRKAQSPIQKAKLILPDLVVKQIKLLTGSGLNPKRGMKVLVANVGEADASENFYLTLVLKRAATPSTNGKPSYDGKEENYVSTIEPLAKGTARWVNFEALNVLNDGSNNEIYAVVATVDALVVVNNVTSIWPPKGTVKTEGNFIKESNEKNNELSPDPNTIKP